MPPYKISPIPLVFIKIPSAFPAGTTLVSPVATLTPVLAASSAMLFIIFLRSSKANPSSIINPRLKNKGLAPITDKSFTVPATHNFPMSPPLKKTGLTVKPSVVNAIFCGDFKTAASSNKFIFWFDIPAEIPPPSLETPLFTPLFKQPPLCER
jgi:hypothetical protein